MQQTLHELVVVAGWLVLTALINVLIGKHTPEEWERLAEENPRYAALARMLRAAGLDPVKLAEAFVDFVRGKASKVSAAAAVASCVAPAEKSDDKPAEVAAADAVATEDPAAVDSEVPPTSVDVVSQDSAAPNGGARSGGKPQKKAKRKGK